MLAMAAAIAIEARRASAAMVRAIVQTACATTATATTISPCSQPAADTPDPCTSSAKATRAIADGKVKPAHAASPPGIPALWMPMAMPSWLLARSRDHLAEGHKIRVALLIEPLPSDHVFLVEVSEMSNRSAKRHDAEAAGNRQHLEGGFRFHCANLHYNGPRAILPVRLCYSGRAFGCFGFPEPLI